MFWNILKHTSRILLGIVFVFSGYVKAVDPLGFAYKFTDYFTAFGMPWLEPVAFPLAIILTTLEFVVGLMLLTNVFMRYASWLVAAFMAVFTPLTLYLALQEMLTGHEMVHDCGCFGDAWVLTNWETFMKNIILVVPTVIVFIKRETFYSSFNQKTESSLFAMFVVVGLWINIHCYRHLPFHDFRPYKIGTNIPAGMAIPEGAPQAKFDTYLYYSKDGKTQEFTLQNYPQDTTWKFVDSKNIQTAKGYEPPIHDFSIVSDAEGDITEQVLADTNYNVLVVAYSLPRTSYSNLDKVDALYDYCSQSNMGFHALSASTKEEIARFRDETGAKYPFYGTDPITLKTIIRANPGIVLLKGGTVINMWHGNDLPSVNELKAEYFDKNKSTKP